MTFRPLKASFLGSSLIVLLLPVLGGACGSEPPDAAEPLDSQGAPLVRSGITFKTTVVSRFVGATNNGGGTVVATATAAQAWETFSLDDLNGGTLNSGDRVTIRTGGGRYFRAVNGGGAALDATASAAQGWETFTIVKSSGSGEIKNGDVVALRSSTGRYVRAVNGGGAAVDAQGAAISTWEQLTIGGLASSQPSPPDGLVWRQATLTNYTSYPDPGSEECIAYNGCTWAGYFAALSGQQPESWVRANNIVAVHSKDFAKYKLKTLRLRQGSKTIDAKVYDMCSDSDCSGCCTRNAQPSGYLVDVEKYTMQRFGTGSGQVEWACIDCGSNP